MTSVESSNSLLIPPNPSLSPTKPSASILLNGNGREAIHVKIPEPPRTTTPLPQTSAFTSYPLSPSSSSTSSPPLSRSTSSPHPSSAALNSRRLSTPKISFAPLPTIPNELKRRNSISIGVASRKHLLGGSGSGGQGVNRVMMSDEDWENYKKHYDEKSGNDPIDLGQVAKQSARALWGKVKSKRSSSQSSQTSVTSSASTTSTSTSNVSSSAPTPAPSGSAVGLRTVDEDEEQQETVLIGRRRSLSPRRGSLHTIPGSPPPRQASLDSESSPSTTTSAISDTDSDFGDTLSEGEGEGGSPVDTHPSYTPGNRVAAAEASKHKLLDINDKDGDETPRRLPSPPPRKADIEPLPEEDDEDDANGEGRKTPSGYRTRESQWEREHREKRDRSEILGFDPERFGRALDLATKNGEVERD
ncbi:hypothetical protein I302_108961 [Kwoniella bestiolae CBS 10118]|uniref:Uncharacterized protein n=1 Tax=Kwoniella bestiolae CBS 10118 TaxID=1296100 RepID=A0A1B9FUL5_9TREE|nr:hypothetical protein I302_08103 [Kwoniella bestiolae CBS 10118]OCF22454.1 hypothetical protein I302_08103 [Kwoniella bestiolae CBS 10118]